MAERNQIRNLIVEYVASFYAKKKSIPSVRQIVRKFTPNVNRGNIYQLFPGGMKQVCQEANVPLPDRVSQTFEAQRIKTARKEQPRTNDFEPEVYGEDLLGLQRVLGSDSVREALKTARKICSRLSPYAEHYEVKDPLKAIDIMKAGFEHKIGELEGLAQTQTQRAVRAETRAEKAEGKVASLCEGDPEQRMLAAGVPRLVIAFYNYCMEVYPSAPDDLPTFLEKTIINHAEEHGIRIAEISDSETNLITYGFTNRLHKGKIAICS